ncbi:hypothetical protein FNV43_RR00379 [Rhamnella rubrinervis]|uniref:Uncharacterized protein n=1 Tax=Rhamnella rubrinervis TaxID=2594499 RepID=A0A8K0MRC6_9ROSA|nr:hypothetical protein FNV43_RR00379 [Rhamnella rubrinervis]
MCFVTEPAEFCWDNFFGVHFDLSARTLDSSFSETDMSGSKIVLVNLKTEKNIHQAPVYAPGAPGVAPELVGNICQAPVYAPGVVPEPLSKLGGHYDNAVETVIKMLDLSLFLEYLDRAAVLQGRIQQSGGLEAYLKLCKKKHRGMECDVIGPRIELAILPVKLDVHS